MVQQEDLEAQIRRALQLLTQRNGLYREDLLKLLSNELAILREAWVLDEDDVKAVRDQLRTFLIASLRQVSPPIRNPRNAELRLNEEDRSRQFKRVLGTLFNLNKDAERGDLQEERFRWLDSEANVDEKGRSLRIKEASARRDLDHAIKGISTLLARQIRRIRAGVAAAQSSEAFNQTAASPNQEETEDLAAAQLQSPVEPSTPSQLAQSAPASVTAIPTIDTDPRRPAEPRRTRVPLWRRPRLLAAAAVGAAALLVTAFTLWPTDDDAPLAQSGGPLTATILSLADQGSGWSVAFPDDKPDAIQEFVGRTDSGDLLASFYGRGPRNTFLQDAITAGGYIPGQALLQLNLKSDADDALTIHGGLSSVAACWSCRRASCRSDRRSARFE